MSTDESWRLLSIYGTRPGCILRALLEEFGTSRYIDLDGSRLAVWSRSDEPVTVHNVIALSANVTAVGIMNRGCSRDAATLVAWLVRTHRAILMRTTTYHDGSGITARRQEVFVDGEVVSSTCEFDDPGWPPERRGLSGSELEAALGEAAELLTVDETEVWRPSADDRPVVEQPSTPPSSDDISF